MLARCKFKQIVRVCGVALAIIGISGLLSKFYLEARQVTTLPRSPKPSLGRVFPTNIHGVVVYQTSFEKACSEQIVMWSFIALGLSLIVSIIYKRRWEKEPQLARLE